MEYEGVENGCEDLGNNGGIEFVLALSRTSSASSADIDAVLKMEEIIQLRSVEQEKKVILEAESFLN